MPKDLLGLQGLSRADLEALLDRAQAVTEGHPAVLRGAVVATLFYEPSTRTEMSFERAARRAGAELLRCDVDHSSVKKGESLVDTARTLEALGADVLVIRHPAAGAPALAAAHVSCPVINAGDGMHEHPTQGLVDLFTVRQVKGTLSGLRVAVVGDVAHSRVARSAAWGFAAMGAEVVLAGPSTLLPGMLAIPGVTMTASLEDALRGADVVMALRMQLERQAAGDVPTLNEYARLYGITEAAIRRAKPDAILMHPGPVNLGVELTAEAAYGPRSVITRQVENGVFVRIAALEWAVGRLPVVGDAERVPRERPMPRLAPLVG